MSSSMKSMKSAMKSASSNTTVSAKAAAVVAKANEKKDPAKTTSKKKQDEAHAQQVLQTCSGEAAASLTLNTKKKKLKALKPFLSESPILPAADFEKSEGRKEGNPNAEFLRQLSLEAEWLKLRPTVVYPLNLIEGLAMSVQLCTYPTRRKQQILLKLTEEIGTQDQTEAKYFEIMEEDARILTFLAGELSTLLSEEVEKQAKLGGFNIRIWMKQRDYNLPFLGNNFKTCAEAILNAKFWADEAKSIKLICRNKVGRSFFGHLEQQLVQSDVPAECKRAMFKTLFGHTVSSLGGYPKQCRAACLEVIDKNNLRSEKKQLRWNTEFMGVKITFNCTLMVLVDIMVSLVIKERLWNMLPELPGMEAMKKIYTRPEVMLCMTVFMEEYRLKPRAGTFLTAVDFEEYLPNFMLDIITARKTIKEKAKARSCYPGISTMINVLENSFDDYRLTDFSAYYLDLPYYKACNQNRDQICVNYLPTVIDADSSLPTIATNLKNLSQSGPVVFIEKSQLVESWATFVSNLHGGHGAIACPTDLAVYSQQLLAAGEIKEQDLLDQIAGWEKTKPSLEEVEKVATWGWTLDEESQKKIQVQTTAIGSDAVGGVYGDVVRKIIMDIGDDGLETGALVISDTVAPDAKIPDLFDMILNE